MCGRGIAPTCRRKPGDEWDCSEGRETEMGWGQCSWWCTGKAQSDTSSSTWRARVRVLAADRPRLSCAPASPLCSAPDALRLVFAQQGRRSAAVQAAHCGNCETQAASGQAVRGSVSSSWLDRAETPVVCMTRRRRSPERASAPDNDRAPVTGHTRPSCSARHGRDSAPCESYHLRLTRPRPVRRRAHALSHARASERRPAACLLLHLPPGPITTHPVLPQHAALKSPPRTRHGFRVQHQGSLGPHPPQA